MRRYLGVFALLCLVQGQNDSLVSTYYSSGAQKSLGFYTEGVRDGLWTEWYDGEVYEDFGADGQPNTQDEEKVMAFGTRQKSLL